MKIYKLILFTFISLLTFTACENEETIDGHDLTQGPHLLGFAKSNVSESYFTDLGVIDKNYPINVYPSGDGTGTDKEAIVNVTVDTDETTAVNGEYVFNTSSLTIPAGEFFVNLPVGINTANFSPTEPTKVVFNIETPTDGFVVNSLQQTLTITFVGCQSDLDAYTYNVVITRENTGEQFSASGESLIVEGVNAFQTQTVMHFGISPGVHFIDICGELTIPQHDLADTYSNQVTGAAGSNGFAGVVDVNGDFSLRYHIT
jgi:hypothetical protein